MKKTLVTLLGSFALAACGAAGSGPEAQPILGPGASPAETAPVNQGGDLVWVLASFPPTLDPNRATDTTSRDVMRTMLEPLLYFGADDTLRPLLAQSYEQLDDLTWQFQLQQGVTFHDGEPFNAQVVQLNFERFLDPDAPHPRANFLNMIDNTVVVDDYTINFELSFPFAPFPAQITNYAALMISPLAIEEERNGGRLVSENPVGTGPFQLDHISHGDHVRVTRFENHWRGVAQVDSVTFQVIPEPATRFLMIETGEAHGGLLMTSDVPVAQTVPQMDLESVVTTTLNYVGFNLSRPPMDDVRVRQAITMAVNHDDILYGIAEGQGVRAVGPIAPNVLHSPSAELSPLPFDPKRARELLVEAGHADGFTLEIWYNDGNSVRSLISQLIQANLADIGITVNVSSLEWGAYLEATSSGEHDMFVLGWTGGTGDPDIQVQPLFHTDVIGPGGNRFWYSNPEADRLIDQGRLETDHDARGAIYRELTQLLIDDAPAMFLFHPFQPVATNGLSGLAVDFATTPDFFRVQITR